jgi:DNA-directed RNA polymerase specialized sigma24 family protein
MLHLLSKHHNLWINYVLKFNVNIDTAQDIVQEFYLKMSNYQKDIMIGEKINFYFVYLVLRNMVFDLKKKEKRFHFTEEIPHIEEEEYIETDTLKSQYITKWINDNTLQKINYENIEDLEDIYHATIFNEVMLEKKSMKQLSRELCLSYESIRHTIKIIKNEIKDSYETWNAIREDI